MYDFYLGNVLLPVTPDSLKVKIKSMNKTVTLINESEVNILKQPGLTELQLKAMLPQSSYPFTNGRVRSASYYLSYLERLKAGKKRFQFIVSRTMGGKLLFDTNMTVTLEDYQIDEDANDNGFDPVVTISLKQYRAYGTKTVTVAPALNGQPTATVEQPRETENAPGKKTHTVVYGDTLWALAKKHLGDGARYTEIVAANPGVILDPNWVDVGTVINIP